jgi:hypothetical protein
LPYEVKLVSTSFINCYDDHTSEHVR